MSNSKNSSDFNQIRTERGPNAESESQKLPAGWIRTGQQPDSVAKWNAEYAIPSQAAASGQAQHGVDHGSGVESAGQAIGDRIVGGGTVSNGWWNSMDKPAGCFPNPTASVFGQKAAEEQKRQLAEAILKLQDKRNRELILAARRAQVAKQQAALLDEVSADAVAPASERIEAAGGRSLAGLPQAPVYRAREQYDAVRFEALERQVKWLIERGNQHARQISQLLGLVSDLQAKLVSAYVDTGNGYRGLKFATTLTPKPCDGLASSVSVGPMVSAPTAYAGTGTAGCEHDMLKANTTVSAITRKKARCNICAQVWESA